MKPLQVNLPDVSGPGGRKGWNKIVAGVKNGTDLQGEYLEGDKAEMLPGDLLLSVRPIGKAKDRDKFGALLYVADDKAENNLRNLVVRADWPQCAEFLAARCEGLLAGRVMPGECPQCDGDQPAPTVSIEVSQSRTENCSSLEAVLDARNAIIRALQVGVSPQELQTILTAAIVSRRGSR